MAKTIIDMKGIVKKFYLGQPNELTILKGIDLKVEEESLFPSFVTPVPANQR